MCGKFVQNALVSALTTFVLFLQLLLEFRYPIENCVSRKSVCGILKKHVNLLLIVFFFIGNS